MTLKGDLDALCGFTSAYLRKVQSEGHIKWRYLDAVIEVLAATRTGTLDRFIRCRSKEKLYSKRQRVDFVQWLVWTDTNLGDHVGREQANLGQAHLRVTLCCERQCHYN